MSTGEEGTNFKLSNNKFADLIFALGITPATSPGLFTGYKVMETKDEYGDVINVWDVKDDKYTINKDFHTTFPDLNNMISMFNEGMILPASARPYLTDPDFTILDRFLYILNIKKLDYRTTYNTKTFRDHVNRLFEANDVVDKKKREDDATDDATAKLKAETVRADAHKKLFTDVALILTKIEGLETNMDVIVRSLTSQGGSKKKKKHRTKKR
jgi:hypothetical protein